MDEEIRHFLETGETPNGSKAEVRKTVQLPPDVHVRLGQYAYQMSLVHGERVSLAQAVDMALKVAAAELPRTEQRVMLEKLVGVIEAELPESDGWTGHSASMEASVEVNGEQVSMFERNWAGVRATRPSQRKQDAMAPIPLIESKIVVVSLSTGEIVHRQGGTYVQ